MTKGCDPASSQQVGLTLIAKGYHLPLTKSRKQYRVDEAVLRDIQDPLAQAVLIYREKAKLYGTYITPLIDVPRVHTHWNNTRVVTGRLSTTGYPMQTIPEFFRSVFLADDYWYSLDASQIELRVVAWLAQDPVMMAAFLNGEDIHERPKWP